MEVATLTLDKPKMPETAMRAAFVEWFGLHRLAADILVTLFVARNPMDPQIIADKAGGKRSSVLIEIGSLRKALEVESIDYLPAFGYVLTDIGRAECQAVLWTIGEELRRVR